MQVNYARVSSTLLILERAVRTFALRGGRAAEVDSTLSGDAMQARNFYIPLWGGDIGQKAERALRIEFLCTIARAMRRATVVCHIGGKSGCSTGWQDRRGREKHALTRPPTHPRGRARVPTAIAARESRKICARMALEIGSYAQEDAIACALVHPRPAAGQQLRCVGQARCLRGASRAQTKDYEEDCLPLRSMEGAAMRTSVPSTPRVQAQQAADVAPVCHTVGGGGASGARGVNGAW